MRPSHEAYTTFDIVQKLGIKRDRLNDWLTRGYIQPSIQRASGQGTKNLFTRFDLYLIKVFEHMLSRGFSREVATDKIKSLQEAWKPLPEPRLVPPYVAFGETFSRQVREGIHEEKAVRTEVVCVILNDLSEGRLERMKNCDDIYILNFRKLTGEVNRALK